MKVSKLLSQLDEFRTKWDLECNKRYGRFTAKDFTIIEDKVYLHLEGELVSVEQLHEPKEG